MESSHECIAFSGTTLIAAGVLRQVATATKEFIDGAGKPQSVLIFDDRTSHPVEIDFRGTLADVLARLPEPATSANPTSPEESAPTESRGPGRPKLGVVAREVTLLPRHWEWLNAQPGGASVAIRKLVEEAKRASGAKDQKRAAQDAAYRFMSAMAGNLPGFEESTRALFAGDRDRFTALVQEWPVDIKIHALKLAGRCFA